MLKVEEEICVELEEKVSRLEKKISNLENMSGLKMLGSSSSLFHLEPEDKKERRESIEKKPTRRSSKSGKGQGYWSLKSEDSGKKTTRRSSKIDDEKGPLRSSGSESSKDKTSKKPKRRSSSSSKKNTEQVVSDVLNLVCEKDSKSLKSEDSGKKTTRRSSKIDDEKGPLSSSGSESSKDKTSKKPKRRSSSGSKKNTGKVVSDILNGVCEKDSKSKASKFDLEGSTNKEEPIIASATAAYISVALKML
jgi:regulatory protein SIR4